MRRRAIALLVGLVAVVHGQLIGGADKTDAKVRKAFDPPLYDKSKERVEKSHYFVKDFKPLKLGSIRLNKGRGFLRLTAPRITGKQAIDVHSIELTRRK